MQIYFLVENHFLTHISNTSEPPFPVVVSFLGFTASIFFDSSPTFGVNRRLISSNSEADLITTPLFVYKEIAEHESKKITSDIRAVSEIKSILSDQQKEELRKVRDKLIEQMSRDYDISEIKVVFEELFSTSLA
jgi:hypothetical protein